MVDKIDSNSTGLRYALESAPKVLIGSPVWYPLEPNSYDSFGPEYNKISRRPINASRQRRKGVLAGLEASGGWNQDLTFTNLTRLLQGFFFANIHEKLTTKPLNGTQIDIDTVAALDDSYAVAAGMPAFIADDILSVSGSGITGNNGVKVVSANATGTKVTVLQALTDESPANNAIVIQRVGHRFASATLDVVIGPNGLPRLSRASGVVDYTTLGLTVGEWIFIGGDDANDRFANNVGFGRISSIAAGYIELDKTTFTPTAETGTGKTVHIYFGDFIKNESDPNLILQKSYQVERTLGNDGVGVQSEYLVGAFPNELTINIPEEDKINVDLSFISLGHEKYTGTVGVKAGSRPVGTLEEAYNTTVDTTRFRLSTNNDSSSVYTPLFTYATEATITINNNVSPNKAISVLGGFNATAGLFEVGGDIKAYFSTVEAIQAIEDNDNVSLDVWIQRENKGLMFDIGLLTLADGKLDVALDEPVTVPLTSEAAENKFNATLLFGSFAYLPNIAS